MKNIVIKYGGAAMQSPELMQAVMEDIARLSQDGFRFTVIHGGGPEISRMCQSMGITPQFVDGLRITDKETMEIVRMVLVGKVNKDLVAHLNQFGVKAVGLSGQDGNLIVARKATHPSGTDLGYVGDVEQVNPEILTALKDAGYIPLVASVATSYEGNAYNVNADHAASQIAIAIKADHLVFLTDVSGVLENSNDPSTLIKTIKADEVSTLISSGVLSGGMIPKATGAVDAINRGVREVNILDGRVPHVILKYLQGIEQLGTTFKR